MASKLTTLSAEKSATETRLLSKQSIQWLMNKIATLRNLSSVPTAISKEKFRQTNQFKLGRLYFFSYDPKGKDDLPYYDKFPLVLVLEKYNDGFLGLNLHYLPIRYRVAFLGKLLEFASMNDKDEITRIRITYDILNATKRLKEFRPCIKQYLMSNVKSKILAVEPHEWEVATFLPIHQFKKAKPQKVWEDSIEQIRN